VKVKPCASAELKAVKIAVRANINVFISVVCLVV
jgi:hypothetical protein